MLAYSFQLLNQADLAYQLLEEEGVKEREAQKTFLEDGYRALRQAQLLVHSSPGKIPYLVNHFELALLPLMVFNSLIQVRMNFSDSFAKVMVHLNSQGTFTAHFKAGSDHIIENGPVYALANYIEKTFPNLNFSATRVDGLNTLIDHNLLMSLVAKDADRNTVATQLSKSGISRKITEKLTDDIMSHKMRGMLTHSLASSKATLDEVEKCKKNYFLLLQGESRCWVCTFYNFPDDKSGRLELVNRQRFIDRINEYVQSK